MDILYMNRILCSSIYLHSRCVGISIYDKDLYRVLFQILGGDKFVIVTCLIEPHAYANLLIQIRSNGQIMNGINTGISSPDSKVHGANMGPIWGRQDPGGPHVGPMNFVIWA